MQIDLNSAAAELDRLAEDAERHKKAFRVAFDLLKEFWPPRMDEEYWVQVCTALSVEDVHCGGDPLARELLLAVFDYLEGALVTERLDRKNQMSIDDFI